MKKLFIAIIMVCSLSSCFNNEPDELYDKVISVSTNRTIQIVEIDSCEYIYMRRFSSISLVHKGNCKYCKLR